MSETMLSQKMIRGIVFMSAGIIALTGCTSHSEREVEFKSSLLNTSPERRVWLDYVQAYNNVEQTNNLDGCMSDTPYDTNLEGDKNARYQEPKTEYNISSDIFTITPVNGEPTLKMTNFNQSDSRVKPLDEASEKIFKELGCLVTGYVVS